jgi:hypothetical protein
VRIEARLGQFGFRTRWLDSSHLGAVRPGCLSQPSPSNRRRAPNA